MTVQNGNKKIEIDGSRRVSELLKSLGLNPESHLVIVNGRLTTEDEVIPADANVKIIKVVSGG